MYFVTREFSFDSAHSLRGYKGKCAQIHGHEYRVEVTCESNELDVLGMVIDFGILNKILKEQISDVYDHTMLNDMKPFDVLNPTAENMAQVFYDIIVTHVSHTVGRSVYVTSVRVWESSKSVAEYRP